MHLQKMNMIFKNTLQKEYRNKALIFISIVTVIMIVLLTTLMSYLKDMILDPTAPSFFGDGSMMIFFWCINAWSGFLAILLGAGCIRSDFSSGVISQILSLPIKRSEYLVARIAGTWFIVIFYYFVSFLLGGILLSISTDTFVFNPVMLLAFLTSSLTITASIVMSIFVSFYFSKVYTFVSVVGTSFIVSIANNYFMGRNFSEYFEPFSLLKLMGASIHSLLPRLGDISKMTSAFITGKELEIDPLMTVGHFAVTFFIMLIFVKWIFDKKDI